MQGNFDQKTNKNLLKRNYSYDKILLFKCKTPKS